MNESVKYTELLEDAKRYYVSGYDDTYIANQFAEQGVSDEQIEAVLSEVRTIRKSNRRRTGMRLLVSGVSIAAVGITGTLLTYFSADWHGPVSYVLMGTIIAGVATAVSGLTKLF